MLFAADAAGNLQFFLNLGGWNGYVPGHQSAANSYNVTAQNGQLPLTDKRAATERKIDATDEAIRSLYSRSSGWMTRIAGKAADFGLPMHQAAVAEGEGNAGSYEAAVDAVLAEGA